MNGSHTIVREHELRVGDLVNIADPLNNRLALIVSKKACTYTGLVILWSMGPDSHVVVGQLGCELYGR